MSLSATGNPYDNATAESCFTTLKPEEVYRKDYPTFAEAEANLGQFIDDVYNSKRLHSSLGDQPPAEVEAAYGQSMAEMTLPTGPVTGGHSKTSPPNLTLSPTRNGGTTAVAANGFSR